MSVLKSVVMLAAAVSIAGHGNYGEATRTASQQPVYLDPSQPIDRRVDDLMSKLTLAEKGSLLGTGAPAIERLKVPVMNGWNQSLHGIVWTQPDHDVPRADRHGVDVGHATGARRRVGDRRRGPGGQQLLADDRRADRAVQQWPGADPHRRRRLPAQRAGLPLAGHQHQPASALGPDRRGVRRGSVSSPHA